MDTQKLYEWKNQQIDANIGILDNQNDIKQANDVNMALKQTQNTNIIDKELSLNNQIQNNVIDSPLIQDNRQKVADNMSTDIVMLSHKQELVREGKYTFLSKKGERLQGKRNVPSKYMAPILDKLAQLDNMLDEIYDPKKMDAILKCFKETIFKCEDYISNRNPWTAEGKARLQMVKDFKSQIQNEAVMFEDRVNELIEKPELVGANRTWLSILSEVRTEDFNDGEEDVKVGVTGNTTSVVYVLEKGGKKRFFKQNEKLITVPSVHPTLDKEIVVLNENKDEQSLRRARYINTMKSALHSQYPYEQYAFNYVMNHRKEQTWDVILDTMFGPDEQYRAMMDEIKATKDKKYIEGEIKYLGETLLKACRDYKLTVISQDDAGIEPGANISKRNVATSRMAKLLGLEDMVAKSSMANVTVKGKKMQGVAMEEAKGHTYNQIYYQAHAKHKKSYGTQYTPTAFKQLLKLQVFDVICGQIDRNTTNYLCENEVDKKKRTYNITSIKAIDNDTCFGTLSYKKITESEKGVHELKGIENKGKLTIPYMDKALADSILAIEDEKIHYMFCDILNKNERTALIDRINGIKKAIRKQMAEENKKRAKNQQFTSFFIQDDEKGDNWKNAFDAFESKTSNEYFNYSLGGKNAVNKKFENTSYLKPHLIVGE